MAPEERAETAPTRTGSLFMVSAPSGAGKSTLLRRVMAEDRGLIYSVSHTTRAPRAGEVDGEDYFFTDVDRFRGLVKEGAFLEWAEVHGNYYGTSAQWVRAQLEAGRDVALDIDVAGAAQIKAKMPEAIGVFILPPGYQELRRRLETRGLDSAGVVARRLKNARGEIERVYEYDYALVNDDLDACCRRLRAVIDAARRRPALNRALIAKIIESFELSG